MKESSTESRDIGPRCPECGSRNTITYAGGTSSNERYKRCRQCGECFKSLLEIAEEGDTIVIRETPIKTENRGAGSRRKKRQSELLSATAA